MFFVICSTIVCFVKEYILYCSAALQTNIRIPSAGLPDYALGTLPKAPMLLDSTVRCWTLFWVLFDSICGLLVCCGPSLTKDLVLRKSNSRQGGSKSRQVQHLGTKVRPEKLTRHKSSFAFRMEWSILEGVD